MGQHFVSILCLYYIYIDKQKDPEFYLGAVIYCLPKAVKLRFTGILLMFEYQLFKK